MTHRTLNGTTLQSLIHEVATTGFESLPAAMSELLNIAMEAEREILLNAGPHERTAERTAYANGFKPRTLRTSLGEIPVRVPQVRGKDGGPAPAFRPRALELGTRSERALKLGLAEMWVKGVSTRKVKAVLEEMCGLEVSSSQVSRASKLLDEELAPWRDRPLGEVPYVILDALYHKVRHGGRVVSQATLIAIGVQPDGRRIVLGVSVSLSEAEVHWREFLASLQARGLNGVRYVVSDDHAGIKAALAARLPGVTWNRCHVHMQRNASAHVPRLEMRKDVAETIRHILRAEDENEARQKLAAAVDQYQESAPSLAKWMEDNLPEGFGAFQLPPAHRRRLATSNSIENLNRQIRRRTRTATLFPSEDSLLRLVTAILVEISEEWETGRIYLDVNKG